MKLSAEMRAFEERIGHRFDRPELLVRALTHGSVSSPNRTDNQRLEFLGDRVLGLAMASALLDDDKAATEGQLAPRFNTLVRKETCADVAREIGLGEVLKLGRSEMLSGGRRKQALLGDAMEAVIAAVFRDAGFAVAADMVLRLWGDRIGQVDPDARDAKSALQEREQAKGHTPPRYEVVRCEGPDHAPEFTVAVRLADGSEAQAKATSKRNAEQAAAQQMLDQLC